MTEVWIAYLLVGLFAGVAAGLLGVGGGLIIVPALALLLPVQGVSDVHVMHLAVGTSLATIIFTSLSSIYAHHRRGAVQWPIVLRLTPGIVFGGLLGAYFADGFASETLRVVFGLFELLVALQMWFAFKPEAHRSLPGGVGFSLVGTVIGSISALLGIGGGTLTVPFLTWCNVMMQKAVATSAACGLPIAIAGAVGFLVMGWNEVALPDLAFGYLYLPALAVIVVTSILGAPMGAALAHRLPAKYLKRIFALFLALLGLRMLAG